MSPADPTAWTCPLPLRDRDRIVLGHGGGGQLSSELVDHLFLPEFRGEVLEQLGDAAVVPIDSRRIAVTTDSFVVRPLFFPGGNIGSLAVHGTVNDLAMRGAEPRFLTAAFILEEGLPLDTLGRIVTSMAAAARDAGVAVIAGDTKVVERGHGDGVYINTTGIGVLTDDCEIGPARGRPGDVVLLSGSIGDHGMAIMSVREGLTFESEIESDSAPLHGLVAAMLAAAPGAVRVLRDPTRGGVAAALHEIARASKAGVELEERDIPVRDPVRSACEILGLDPLLVANEGKVVAIVSPDFAPAVLAAMRAHRHGADARPIGRVVADHAGMVVMRTTLGARRVVPLPVGEQLPRIC